MAQRSNNSKRNIVFFGETGAGKSSVINLLLGTTSAPVSNDSQPCTQANSSYETRLNGTAYNLWDTRGLSEGRSFFQKLFGTSAETDLKKFLKKRHGSREIDLLVYCVRGSRATKASVKYYNKFCAITRRLAAPVVIVVTQLEREEDMEGWWSRNSVQFKNLNMDFDDHACITSLPQHPRQAESKEKLVRLVTRPRRWEIKESGSYFGSPVKKLTTSTPPSRGGIRSLFKPTNRSNVGREAPSRRSSNCPSPASSTPESSYHTVPSPADSIPSSPIVEPPTPCSVAPSVPQINTDLLTGDSQQPSSEETSTSSMRYSPHSMLYASSHSSCTSHSEVYLESCTEENDDFLGNTLCKASNSTVKRRGSYATRGGAFGDVWECDLISEGSSRMVAVKAVRINTSRDADLRVVEKKLRRELKVWRRLRHKNIVPLLGVVSGFGPLPSAISPWFSNGSLSHYLVYHQISELDKHHLLGDIAVGLSYLHGQGVVHGDLHSDNVLINDHGTACLTDFGLSFMSDFVGTSYLKSGICGVVQFADPALVQQACNSQDNLFYPSKPCDIYSFGGLMLHVLSGKKPYDGIPRTEIIVKVSKGQRPEIANRHNYVTPWHMSLIRLCWDPEECKRPLADDLVRRFDAQ